jgi:hypothetical protein
LSRNFSIGWGSVEVIKWLAATAMLCDHLNHYLFNYAFPHAFNVGRAALPLFAVTFAYGLAQGNVKNDNRCLWRLLAAALISSCFYIPLMGSFLTYHLFPLNILFAFIAALLIIQAIEGRQYRLATVMFCLLGLMVEFWHPALLMMVSLYFLFKTQRGRWFWLFTLAMAFWGICAINGNLWALVSIPVVFLVSVLKLTMMRVKYFLYVFYPLHLALIWLYVNFGR